jgi:plasmid stability protein
LPECPFVPWAGYIQDQHGKSSVLEQRDILARLLEQREDNPDEVNLEVAIQHRKDVEEVKIKIV